LPLDRVDVDAILKGIFDASVRLGRSSTSWRSTMAKKRKKILTDEERARFAETMKLLEDRIAYHRRKLAEERAAAEPGEQR
jgi:hypothetical protein